MRVLGTSICLLLCCLCCFAQRRIPSPTAQWTSAPPGTIPYDKLISEGQVALGLGQLQKASTIFGNAIALHPVIVIGWIGLAIAESALGRSVDKMFETAKRLDPRNPDVLRILSDINSGKKIGVASLDLRDNALVDPHLKEQHIKYMTNLYLRYYELETGVSRLQQGIRMVGPEMERMVQLGNALVDLLRHEEAFTVAKDIVEKFPHEPSGYCLTAEVVFNGVLWQHWESTFVDLTNAIQQQVRLTDTKSCVSPLRSLLYPISALLHLQIVSSVANRVPRPNMNFKYKTATPGKGIKIGYISSHFTSSSIGREMLYILAAHDRSFIQVMCFDIGNKNDKSVLASVWRSAIESICIQRGGYVELHDTSTAEAASLINRHGIQILLDLNGWSGGHRADVLAARPAPLQINYKNYVASPGMKWLDFTIGDMITSPPDYGSHYLESLCLVPPSYFVSGHRYQYSIPPLIVRHEELFQARIAAKLNVKENGIIFANFNNLDKLDPILLRGWMTILSNTNSSNSMLWFQQYPPAKAQLITAQCSRVGIPPERTITTSFSSHDEHITVKSLADIFLDNLLYNGHSTAMDALWGRLPILASPQEKMSSRVSASMLYTLGMPELIAYNLQDYVDIAVALGNRPKHFARLRRKLDQACQTSSLFDTITGVRNFERALKMMYETNAASTRAKKPHILVTAKKTQDEPNIQLENYLYSLKVTTDEMEKMLKRDK